MKISVNLMVVVFALVAGCGRNHNTQAHVSKTVSSVPPAAVNRVVDPLKLVLMPAANVTHMDYEISRFQKLIRDGQKMDASVEHLGWLYIAKARETFDPGYYKLAEACADVLASHAPGSAESLLLRGYVLENLHRFQEAEPIARELTVKRGLPFDFGLLGDSLMEQGRLDEAVAAYQSMVDLRPDLHSYARVAHIRWLKGDLAGAIEMMAEALSASSPRDPDSAAWVSTRLGGLEFLAGRTAAAQTDYQIALQVASNYPPALLLRGRILLAQNKAADAVETLQMAEHANPLPEYQWTLADALRAVGHIPEALALETRLRASGAAADPRTFALFLATRGEDAPTALRLAQAELQQRHDIFTHDALAWALAANGRLPEAQSHMTLALAEGTEDARLFFHAASIAQRAGQWDVARTWAARARQVLPALLPSERDQLGALEKNLATQLPPALSLTAGNFSAPALPEAK